MLILFEGPDLCGKSEISKEVSKMLGCPRFKDHRDYEKLSGQFDRAKNELLLLLDFIPQLLPYTEDIIFDRFYASEWVYSKAFSRKCDFEFLMQFEKMIMKYDPITIYCYKDTYKNYNDEYVPIEMQTSIKAYYEEFLANSSIPYLKVNTTDENMSRELLEIQQFIF